VLAVTFARRQQSVGCLTFWALSSPIENIIFYFYFIFLYSLTIFFYFFSSLKNVFFFLMVSNFSGSYVIEIFLMCVFTESVIDVFLLVL